MLCAFKGGVPILRKCAGCSHADFEEHYERSDIHLKDTQKTTTNQIYIDISRLESYLYEEDLTAYPYIQTGLMGRIFTCLQQIDHIHCLRTPMEEG